jgi:diguanylate cyclase (GGDEF)-like protein/PAS domain S-box-containing protein
MRGKLRDLSIKRKLNVLTFGTRLVMFAILTVSLIITDHIVFRKAMLKDLTTLAEVIGVNSAAALSFNDPKSADETLAALRAAPNVISAYILTKNQTIFAKYLRSEDTLKSKRSKSPGMASAPKDEPFQFPERVEDGYSFSHNLHLFKQIMLDGEPIGMVYIQSDLKRLSARKMWYVGIVLMVLIITTLGTSLVSSVLHSFISKPILYLAQKMKTVSEERDYAIRVEKQGNDELGVLYDGFNEMLVQIQERDRALLNVQTALQNQTNHLEKELNERKRIEEEVRESEERFRQLAENIREVFYICEIPEPHITRFLYVSPAYKEVWGRPCEGLYQDSKSFWDAVYPSEKDRVIGSFMKRRQEEVEEQYRIKRPDGSILWIKDRSFPVFDGSGKAYRIVGIAADITDQKLGEEKLKYLSLHDTLTGLYNRVYFEEELRRIEKMRYKTIGILSCDLDGLKMVNDTLGHDRGDVLLIGVANVMRECFREGDVVARIGGDEFSVILPNASKTVLESSCQRIREAVARYNVAHPELPLNISIGFAVKSGESISMRDLLKEADSNMYREKLYHKQSIRRSITQTLVKTLKERDVLAEKHVGRLEKLLTDLAILAGLPESTVTDLRLLAQFHDIGNVGVSDQILLKKGPLTPDEWTEMQRHSEVGFRIALSAPDLNPIADWILKHHEWWNGQGYPFGLKGEEIPIECRLLAIVDAYEALTNVRPYRKAFSPEEALAELRSRSGSQFDPGLLAKFIEMLEIRPSDQDSQIQNEEVDEERTRKVLDEKVS